MTSDSKPHSVQEAVTTGTRVVWKFPVPMATKTGRAFIDLPVNAEVLSAGMQLDEMVVWVLVDPITADEVPTETRRLIVANTGENVPGFPIDARFLGTLTTSNGIVWHVWDGDA